MWLLGRFKLPVTYIVFLLDSAILDNCSSVWLEQKACKGMIREVKCGQCQWLYFLLYWRKRIYKQGEDNGEEAEVRDGGENILMAHGILVLQAHYTLAFYVAWLFNVLSN